MLTDEESMLLPSQVNPYPHPSLVRVYDPWHHQSTHELSKLPLKANNAPRQE